MSRPKKVSGENLLTLYFDAVVLVLSQCRNLINEEMGIRIQFNHEISEQFFHVRRIPRNNNVLKALRSKKKNFVVQFPKKIEKRKWYHYSTYRISSSMKK
jgi:hypothetical protein